jgi:hypothetical protein
MATLPSILAYVVACICVAFALVIMISIAVDELALSQILLGWVAFSLFVGAAAAAPTAIFRWLARKYQVGNVILAALAGGLIGAAVSAIFFGPWPNSYYLASWSGIALPGAVLGIVGGVVYWCTEVWLRQKSATGA